MRESKRRPANPSLPIMMGMCAISFVLTVVAEAVGGQTKTALYCVLVAIVIVAIATSRRLRVRQGKRFVREATEASEALARGDFAAARAGLTPWAEQLWLPRATAAARLNLAWTRLREGELTQALELFTRNDAGFQRHLAPMGSLAMSAADLALAHVLVGDLEKAEHWVAIAEQRATEGLQVPGAGAMTTFTRAALHCRAGRFEDAVRLLDERWTACEGALVGATLRPLRVIRAFAIASSDPRNAGVAEATLATSRPNFPGEYDFLGVEWPEMAAFLAAHDLATKPVNPS